MGMTQYIQSESVPAVIFPFTANALIVFTLPRHSSPSFSHNIMGGSAYNHKQLLYSSKGKYGGSFCFGKDFGFISLVMDNFLI